jgi:hypothetical protein
MSFLPRKIIRIFISIFTLVLISNLFVSHGQLPNVTEQTTTVAAYVHYDLDGDGMDNWWELLYGLDPDDPSDAALDLDGDGLTNLTEFTHLTNPLRRDTDGGGVWDDLEIYQKKNPLDPADDFRPIDFRGQPEEPNDPRGDSDGDGISNTDEDRYGTNKHKVDTDDDGLNDFDELFKFLTNPLEQDTDQDGLSDYEEVVTYLTNPTIRDTDFDGLLDSEEVHTYGTNPTIWDTDGGGMSDFDEINNGSDPLEGDDDYQFTWIIYYGNEANDIFKSLEQNKIDIYEGMSLTLESILPSDADKLTVSYNGKDFATQKEYLKLKLLSPEEPGFYTISLTIDLKTGQKVSMTRFVEIKQRGRIIKRVDGQFDGVYDRFEYFDDEPVDDAKISIFNQNELSGDLELYHTNVFEMVNPLYTDGHGSYLLALEPGNYLIKINKPEYGSKDILYDSDNYSLYSQDIYLTYNYDAIIWGLIFFSIFIVVWYILYLLEHLKLWIEHLIEKRIVKRHTH